MACCMKILRSISLEPVVIMSGLGLGLYGAFIPPEQNKKVIAAYIDELLPLYENGSFVEAEAQVQKRLTEWSIYKGIVSRPLLIVMTLLMGALSDIHGRKPLILLSLMATVLSTFFLNAFYDEHLNLPMWFMLVQAFVLNICGGKAAEGLSAAYIVDRFPDPKILSLRLMIIIICAVAAGLVGNNLGGVIFYGYGLSLSWIMLVAQFSVAGGFLYAMVFVQDIMPVTEENAGLSTTNSSPASTPLAIDPVIRPPKVKLPAGELLKKRLRQLLTLQLESVKVPFKPREGSKRALLILTIMFTSLTAVSEKQEDELIGIYTQQSPFYWTDNEYRWFTNCSLFAVTLGSLFGMLLFKAVLGLRDTTIIIIGLFVNIIDVGTIALAPTVAILAEGTFGLTQREIATNFVYVGTVLCDGFVFAIVPAAQSFLSTLVPNNEVGKVYAVLNVMENIEAIFQLAVLQPIYIFTVGWFTSCIWVILCLLNALAMSMMIWVHIVAKKEHLLPPSTSEAEEALNDQMPRQTTTTGL